MPVSVEFVDMSTERGSVAALANLGNTTGAHLWIKSSNWQTLIADERKRRMRTTLRTWRSLSPTVCSRSPTPPASQQHSTQAGRPYHSWNPNIMQNLEEFIKLNMLGSITV